MKEPTSDVTSSGLPVTPHSAAAALLLAPEATTRLEAAEAASQSPLQNVKPKVVSTDERSNGFEEITSQRVSARRHRSALRCHRR